MQRCEATLVLIAIEMKRRKTIILEMLNDVLVVNFKVKSHPKQEKLIKNLWDYFSFLSSSRIQNQTKSFISRLRACFTQLSLK